MACHKSPKGRNAKASATLCYIEDICGSNLAENK